MTKRQAISDKIMILGCDGMDPRLTKKYVAEGKMPHVAEFIRRGAANEDLVLLGGHPTVTPSMWTTLSTGCYANVHGITGFDVSSPKGLDYIRYALDSSTSKAEPLWNVFAEAGKKTLVWHWPGCSWPPTSDNPNLMVVDGTSPGSVGMSTVQFDSDMLVGANESIAELTFLRNVDENVITPCTITGMDVPDSGGIDQLGNLIAPENHLIIREKEEGSIGCVNTPMDVAQSPIKPAEGWAAAPAGAKEFTLLLSGGLVVRPVLILANAQGEYDRIAIYKNKKETQPIVTLTEGEFRDRILDIGYKNEQKVDCVRNMKLVHLEKDGSELKLYVSSAMEIDFSGVVHPKALYDVIVDAAGYAPPTAMLGQQEDELINKIMFSTWNVTAQWQAKALQEMLDHQGVEILFSHYHAIDLQEHMFIRYMTDKGYNKMPPETYQQYMEDIYVQTDNYLGQFLKYLDQGWTIFIVSDHAQVCSKHDFVAIGDLLGINVGLMSEVGLTALKKDADGNPLPEIDWEHTLAVAQRESHIYVNLSGRDPHGIVAPEEKYEVEEEIMTRLYGYRHPVTGKRVIALALRNKDAVLLGLGGPESGDVVYFVAEGYNYDHADSLSTTWGEANTSVSPIFIAAGKGIKENCQTPRIIRQVDVVPTMAYLGGVRVPKQCEGALAYQILEEEF